MTVTYNAEVATSKFFTFTKLLFKWRGSAYKILLSDFLMFAFFYTLFAVIYHYVLVDNSEHKKLFELFCYSTNKFMDWIPLTFVLAFYVSLVIKRWWDMITLMPWPDSLALKVTSLILGFDEGGRRLRRTLMRYVNVSLVLLLREISVKAKKNFPTLQHVVNAGLLTPSELTIIEEIESPDRKFWIPLVWCTALVRRARMEGRIRHDYSAQVLLEELNNFRESLLRLKNYDWINIPLVYTQVVTIAVYVYFFACVFARQRFDSSDHGLAVTEFFYLPIFTILEFFFFMGWLKVAESLVNPFGENDEDLEIIYIIDRNIKYSAVVVDLLHNQYPELKDPLEDPVPPDMPYTVAAMKYKQQTPYAGSTVNVHTTGEDAFIVKDVEDDNLTPLEENILQDLESGVNQSFMESRVPVIKTLSRTKEDAVSSVGKSNVNIPVVIRTGSRSSVRGEHRRGIRGTLRRTLRLGRDCCFRVCSLPPRRYTIIVKEDDAAKDAARICLEGANSSFCSINSEDGSRRDSSPGRSTPCSTSTRGSRSPSASSVRSNDGTISAQISRKSGGAATGAGVCAASTPTGESRPKRPMTAKERNSRSRVLNRKLRGGESTQTVDVGDMSFKVRKTDSMVSSEGILTPTWRPMARARHVRAKDNTVRSQPLSVKERPAKSGRLDCSNSATTSAKGSSRRNSFLPQESYTSFTSDIRIRRPNNIRVYDSHTSLTSHQSNIDDVPRVQKPGRYRTSSNISAARSNARSRRTSIHDETEPASPAQVGICVADVPGSAAGVTLEPETEPTTEPGKSDSAALGETFDPNSVVVPETVADVQSVIVVDEVEVLGQPIVVEEANLIATLPEGIDANSPSTEKQVTFNLDPQTILVDPSLPAASTMEGALVESSAESAGNDVAADVKLDAEDSSVYSSVYAEEETDTCSTVSSIPAAEAYRPEYIEYIFDKKPGVAILEPIAECSSDVSLTSQSSSISSKPQSFPAVSSKAHRRFSVSNLGSVEERLEERLEEMDKSVSMETLSVREANSIDAAASDSSPPTTELDTGTPISSSTAVVVTASELETLDDAANAIEKIATEIEGGTETEGEGNLEKILKGFLDRNA